MRMDALIASVSAQNSDSDAEEDTEAEDDKTV